MLTVVASPCLAPDLDRAREVPCIAQRLDDVCRFVDEHLDRSLPTPHVAPAALHGAMRSAVFPGGKRLRATLVVLVAEACAGPRARSELVGRFAAAIELVHCASLVHDDLPAFDDAPTRRGRPSCHAAFGEPTAILAGDALLALAFDTLARTTTKSSRALRLVQLLGEAVGSRRGIIGGQALEQQATVDLHDYHARKTAALFRAAAAGAALAVGHPQEVSRWSRFGELVGLALQLHDDLADCTGDPATLGKPVGQDAALGRPNAAIAFSPEAVGRELTAMQYQITALLGPPSSATLALRVLAGCA